MAEPMRMRDIEAGEIEAHLLVALRVRFGAKITPSTDLSRLGVDSLSMADLIMDLEDEFNIRVDQEIFDIDTARGLAVYITQRQSATR